MAKLGLRCWADKFSYVVADGSKDKPKLLASGVVEMPVDLNRAGCLNWVRKEMRQLATTYSLHACRYKALEPAARLNRSLLERAEVEGVVQEAMYDAGCKDTSGVIKKQLKASLCFEGSAKEVARSLSGSAFSDLEGTDCEEAALAAWSALKEE